MCTPWRRAVFTFLFKSKREAFYSTHSEPAGSITLEARLANIKKMLYELCAIQNWLELLSGAQLCREKNVITPAL